MGLSKNAKGADWKKETMIFFLDKEFGIDIRSKTGIENLRGLYDFNAEIIRIYYYKEKSDTLENNAAFYATICGLVGVGVVIGVCMGPVATAAYIKGAKIAGGVLGGAMAGGGVIAGLTTEHYAFHGFLVLECSKGNWMSLEKNEERVCIQIGKTRDDVINFKNGGSYDQNQCNIREEISELANREGKKGCSIEKVLEWAIMTKKYHILTDNCKNFAAEGNSEFVSESDQSPLPGYVDLLIDDTKRRLESKGR